MGGMRHLPASRVVDTRAEAVGSTVVAAALALAAGAVWALVLSTDSLLAQPVSVPASMAAGLLLASSYPAWSLSRFSDAGALLFPALLMLVSFSELLAVHHDVESASGIDWQAFYLPVLLCTMAVGWKTFAGSESTAGARTGMLVAAAGWGGALLIEVWQWRIGEAAALHAQLADVKNAIEVLAAASLFIALSMLDRSRLARSAR
jgi:hypothetical protein